MARTLPTPPAPDEPLAAKLRRLVEKRRNGRLNEQIALEAGMSPQQFSKLLVGHTPDPRYKTLKRLLDALDSTFCELEKI